MRTPRLMLCLLVLCGTAGCGDDPTKEQASEAPPGPGVERFCSDALSGGSDPAGEGSFADVLAAWSVDARGWAALAPDGVGADLADRLAEQQERFSEAVAGMGDEAAEKTVAELYTDDDEALVEEFNAYLTEQCGSDLDDPSPTVGDPGPLCDALAAADNSTLPDVAERLARRAAQSFEFEPLAPDDRGRELFAAAGALYAELAEQVQGLDEVQAAEMLDIRAGQGEGFLMVALDEYIADRCDTP